MQIIIGTVILWPLQDIVYFQSFVHESIVLSFVRPACIAHTVAILLHGYQAIYDPPPTFLWYAIHHTILVITISCRGQVILHHIILIVKLRMIIQVYNWTHTVYISIYILLFLTDGAVRGYRLLVAAHLFIHTNTHTHTHTHTYIYIHTSFTQRWRGSRLPSSRRCTSIHTYTYTHTYIYIYLYI